MLLHLLRTCLGRALGKRPAPVASEGEESGGKKFRQETRSVFLKPRVTVTHLHPLLEPGHISKAGLLWALPEATCVPRRRHGLVPSCLSTISWLLVCPTGPVHAAGASLRCHQPTTDDNAKELNAKDIQAGSAGGSRAWWQSCVTGVEEREKYFSPALELLAAPTVTSTASPAAQHQLSPLHGHAESCLLTPLCPWHIYLGYLKTSAAAPALCHSLCHKHIY